MRFRSHCSASPWIGLQPETIVYSVFLWPIYIITCIILYLSQHDCHRWSPINVSKLVCVCVCVCVRFTVTLDLIFIMYHIHGWYLKDKMITCYDEDDNYNDNNYSCVRAPTAAASHRRRSREEHGSRFRLLFNHSRHVCPLNTASHVYTIY